MIDTWMEHKYTSNNAEQDDLPSSSEPLSEVLLATPFSSQYQTAFRLVDGDPDDDENYNYLGQTVRLCNAGEGCHGYYDYWTCYEAHYECGGAFHEEQVLSELSHGSIEHLENKLRIFIEQAKAEVVADEIRFHGCDGSVKAHVKLTAALRAAVLRIDSKRLIVRNHSA
ncbi:MAG: hypothetical protein ABJB74_08755 [Gemmatimonas sp.]